MQTDEALAAAVQKGDEAALNSLIERYYSPLLGYLFRMAGGQQALAEDMVQESFLRMMRGILSFNPQRNFKAWLYTIATNIARNHYRKADNRLTENVEEDADFATTDSLPEITLIHEQESAKVLNCLMQVPEHQRSVIVLFYYEDLSQKEIAEILAIPVGTVKSRLSKGLGRLKTLLVENESHD